MRIKRQDGFSMLEVMIGLIVFSLGLLLLSSMMMVSLKGNKWSNVTTDVVQLLRDKVEDYRYAEPAEMVAGADVVDGIRRSWYFRTLPPGNLQELTVVLEWSDEREAVQACTTITYIQI
jgi:prepilin-type N-terminal cleavage/methylation domain-containing protein